MPSQSIPVPASQKALADNHDDNNSCHGPSACNSFSGSLPVLPSSLQYFHGRLTREETEQLLRGRGGNTEGLFLLRESMSPGYDTASNYAISVLHGDIISHYLIEKRRDGRYRIPAGTLSFSGPVELLYYYWFTGDGMVTPLTAPCDRNANQPPVAFRGMTYDELEQLLQSEARRLNLHLDSALSPTRERLLKQLIPTLHLSMPWFHGLITRQVAESRVEAGGHQDGKFLVRSRFEKNSFAITLSFEGITRHYLITQRNDSRYAIEEGDRFDCLLLLVENYHNKSGGLLCRLKVPCCRPVILDHEMPMVHTSARRDSCGESLPPDYAEIPGDATTAPHYMGDSSYHAPNGSERPAPPEYQDYDRPPDYSDCVFEKTLTDMSIKMPVEDEERKGGNYIPWVSKAIKSEKLSPCNIARTVAVEIKLRTCFPLYLVFFLLLVAAVVVAAIFA